MKRTNILALLAASALILGAVAMPAAAEEDQSESDAQSDQERKEKAQERRDAAREKMQERRDAAKEQHKERHEEAKEAHKAQKAMRAHKALQGAIQALEHRIVKLEFMEHRIQDALENPNSTDMNQTELEHKLERVEAAQEKMMERLQHLYDKQAQLRERWHAHVHGDDADDASDVDAADDVDEQDDAAPESEESPETESDASSGNQTSDEP